MLRVVVKKRKGKRVANHKNVSGKVNLRVAMRVFVYEFVTASGMGRVPEDAEHSLYLEGRAMRDALASDLVAAGHSVTVLPESTSLIDDELLFRAASAECDAVFVIAPETGGWLLERSRLAAELGVCVIGPTPEAIQLTSSKSTLAARWSAFGVRTPLCDRFGETWNTFPAVLKPDHGAGSQNTYLVNSSDEARAAHNGFATGMAQNDEMIFTEFVQGLAVSVALLCGPRDCVPLVPALQNLSRDGRFSYRGGELPLSPELADRAVSLARKATACVPGLSGYVGVDLVLGDDSDGTRDFAIEINPRLTTSYTGLRALANFNIADAAIRIALGESIAIPCWRSGRVTFTTSGAVKLD